jgi:hypothetical protein
MIRGIENARFSVVRKTFPGAVLMVDLDLLPSNKSMDVPSNYICLCNSKVSDNNKHDPAM